MKLITRLYQELRLKTRGAVPQLHQRLHGVVLKSNTVAALTSLLLKSNRVE